MLWRLLLWLRCHWHLLPLLLLALLCRRRSQQLWCCLWRPTPLWPLLLCWWQRWECSNGHVLLLLALLSFLLLLLLLLLLLALLLLLLLLLLWHCSWSQLLLVVMSWG
jgi:hypothetical protein